MRISDWSSDVCSSDLSPFIEGQDIVGQNQQTHRVEQHRGAIEIAQTAQTVLFVGGFGPLHQIGKQNLGQLGGIVLGRRFERMEERGYSRGSTRLLKGRNGRRLADTRYPREPLKGCRGNTPWWRRPQIERPDRIEPIKVTEELGRHALGGHCPQRVQGGERSEEHTSELQSLMRTSYADFFLKKKT